MKLPVLVVCVVKMCVVVVQSFFAQNKSQHYCLGVINEFLAACNFL